MKISFCEKNVALVPNDNDFVFTFVVEKYYFLNITLNRNQISSGLLNRGPLEHIFIPKDSSSTTEDFFNYNRVAEKQTSRRPAAEILRS